MQTEIHELLMAESVYHLGKALTEFEEAPTVSGFLEVSVVAEILSLDRQAASAKLLAAELTQHVDRWLERGLIEELLFTEPDHSYRTAMIASFAPRERLAGVQRLWKYGLIGRTEWSMLQQVIIQELLIDHAEHNGPNLIQEASSWFALGGRALRSRTDDHDLNALLQLAHIFNLRDTQGSTFVEAQRTCSLLCQELVAVCLRTNDLNRLPVLAYLGARFFQLPSWILHAAKAALDVSLRSWESFRCSQEHLHPVTESIGYTERALHLRSATAWTLLLTTS